MTTALALLLWIGFLVAGIGLGVAIAGLHAAERFARRVRDLEGRDDVRSIRGVVEPGPEPLLKSPVGREPCVAVEVEHTQGDDSSAPASNHRRSVPMSVRLGDGRVVQVLLERGGWSAEYWPKSRPCSVGASDFHWHRELEAFGLRSLGSGRWDSVREAVVRVGDELLIVGPCTLGRNDEYVFDHDRVLPAVVLPGSHRAARAQALRGGVPAGAFLGGLIGLFTGGLVFFLAMTT